MTASRHARMRYGPARRGASSRRSTRQGRSVNAKGEVGDANRSENIVVTEQEVAVGVAEGVGVLGHDVLVQKPGNEFAFLPDLAAHPFQSARTGARGANAGGLGGEKGLKSGVAAGKTA